MRDINDFFDGESGMAWQFNQDTMVTPTEDAKRIAIIYAEQFKPKWISVNDALPEVGKFVLVHRIEGYFSVDQYRQLHGETKSFLYNVTHWQELPSAPL